MLLSCTLVGIEKLKSRKKKIFGQKILFKIMIFEKNNFAQQFVCIRGFNWLGPVNNHLKFFCQSYCHIHSTGLTVDAHHEKKFKKFISKNCILTVDNNPSLSS